MQIQADLLGAPIEVSAEPEATSMGVAYLAARATGLWESDARVQAQAKTAQIFEPQLSPKQRKEKLERFEEACLQAQRFA